MLPRAVLARGLLIGGILGGGCSSPLLPGEDVLGVDVSARFVVGEPGDRLGASVAGSRDGWLASAPGGGATWMAGERTALPSAWVGWWGAEEVIVDAEGGVTVAGALLWSVGAARGWAAGGHGILASSAAGLHFVDRGVLVEVSGLYAVSWGTGRILGVVCTDAGCDAQAWAVDGTSLGSWGQAGEGGAVAEWEGVAWAGAPEWSDPMAQGRACSEHGECVVGEPGDHLGAAIGGGRTAGTFNSRIVPPRARLVSLVGERVWALEEGAEFQPIVLDGDDGVLIGAPYHPVGGLPAGVVVRVP